MILWEEDASNKTCWILFAGVNKDKEPIVDENLDQIQKLMIYQQQKTILDIGCGVGLFTKSWIDNGFDYTGIDQINYAVEIAKTKYPEGRFETADILNYEGSFDIVFSHTVLQHVHKNFKDLFLQKIYNLIKPLGYFIVYEDVLNPPKEITDLRAEKWNKHPYLYFKDHWIEIIESFGFKQSNGYGNCLAFVKKE